MKPGLTYLMAFFVTAIEGEAVWGQIDFVTRQRLHYPMVVTLIAPTNAVPVAPAPVVVAYRPPILGPPPQRAEKTEAERAEEARRLLEFQIECADRGLPGYQCTVGFRYLAGDGVERDMGLAWKWLTLSARNGNMQAKKMLGELNRSLEAPLDKAFWVPF